MNILTCEGVCKMYGSGNNQVAALDGVDLVVGKGEFVAVIGFICLILFCIFDDFRKVFDAVF